MDIYRITFIYNNKKEQVLVANNSKQIAKEIGLRYIEQMFGNGQIVEMIKEQ